MTEFNPDRPIESKNEDKLGVSRFSKHLGNSLLNWNEEESLVTAIYGEWGSGKTSILNLAVEAINESDQNNKPTIIRINSWQFSNKDSSDEHLLLEIASNLRTQTSINYKRLSKKLRYLAKLLMIGGDLKESVETLKQSSLVIGPSGILLGRILEFSPNLFSWLSWPLSILSALITIFAFSGSLLEKVAAFFERKDWLSESSIDEAKEEIAAILRKENRNLLIIIDDIDRLNQEEIKDIFKLIKLNADFPKTIYLLAFDRKIVENNLIEQKGESGKNFLEKIVQVGFNIPQTPKTRINSLLWSELEMIINKLPKSAKLYVKTRWSNTIKSALSTMISNLRDVKRFSNSLEFNLVFMVKDGEMEINPVDFIGLEALRVFAPNFYLYLSRGKHIFSLGNQEFDLYSIGQNSEELIKRQREEILKELSKYPSISSSIRDLIQEIFPPGDNILRDGRTIYTYQLSGYNADLRACSAKYFDRYFNLIPGNVNGGGISQAEFRYSLNLLQNKDKFEAVLQYFHHRNAIYSFLEMLHDNVSSKNRNICDLLFTENQLEITNLCQTLMNISDLFPDPKFVPEENNLELAASALLHGFEILNDKKTTFNILSSTIPKSKGLSLPTYLVAHFEKRDPHEQVIFDNNDFESLKAMATDLLSNKDITTLLSNHNFIYIIYRWREWDPEISFTKFANKITSRIDYLLGFLDFFWTKNKNTYNFDSLKKFINLKDAREEFENMKEFAPLSRGSILKIDVFIKTSSQAQNNNGEL